MATKQNVDNVHNGTEPTSAPRIPTRAGDKLMHPDRCKSRTRNEEHETGESGRNNK